jgi:hypothetical protein
MRAFLIANSLWRPMFELFGPNIPKSLQPNSRKLPLSGDLPWRPKNKPLLARLGSAFSSDCPASWTKLVIARQGIKGEVVVAMRTAHRPHHQHSFGSRAQPNRLFYRLGRVEGGAHSSDALHGGGVSA